MIQVSKPIMQGTVSPLDGASSLSRSMSAFGTKQTLIATPSMSVLGGEGDIHYPGSGVRK